MALVTTALKSLIDVGNDAMSRLYELTFSGGLFPDDTSNLTIRCSSFTPPTPSQSTYKQQFITASIERPVPKVGLTRNFSLSFRSDDNWYLYKELLYQQKLTSNATHSFVNTSIDSLKNYFFNVRVNRIVALSDTSDSTVERLFNFNKCWITEIASPKFSSGDATPVTIDCKISFLEMEDWQSGLTNTEAEDSTKSSLTMFKSTSYV